jgi:anaerobic ribonucleoside-triphosphate reductase activating protein
MTGAGATLRVADVQPRCEVLGPGIRFGLWVQGCGIGCTGCISPQWIPFAGGEVVAVAALAERIAREAVDGLTISGGEPFDQAGALAELVRAVRARRDLSALSYTGYTLDHLRRHGTPDQHALLAGLDLLIDGPYLPRKHADLRWRGSANQRIRLLSGRHAPVTPADDRGAGLQFDISPTGDLHWTGVPPVPDFRASLEAALDLTSASPPAEEPTR